MIGRVLAKLSAVCLLVYAMGLGEFTRPCEAQTSFCDPVPHQTTCSLMTINGSCEISLDRANPISFPTIYMKPGAKLSVTVYNTTPFETLTLDLTSFTGALRPDTFQTIFNSLTPNASKATGVGIVPGPYAEVIHAPPAPRPAGTLDEVKKLAETTLYGQNRVIDETDASLVLQQIALAAQGMTRQSCSISIATTLDEFPNPWFQTADWKKMVAERLKTASEGTAKKKAVLTAEAALVSVDIGKLSGLLGQWNDYFQSSPSVYEKLDSSNREMLIRSNKILDTLQTQKTILDSKIEYHEDAGDASNQSQRLKLLSTVINSVSTAQADATKKAGSGQNVVNQFVVDVPSGNKAFNVSGVWALNYTNVLSGVVTQVSQSPYPPKDPPAPVDYAQLGTPPTKTQALSITIQATNKEWVEASAGFVVPVRAYHSYTAAAQASGGAVTGNVVQMTQTHTVVPAAFVNINLLEIPNRHGSWALFVTPFVGYNSTTSTVETGIGPSITWRSIELNMMMDYGNDAYLKGGFTVGQSLGASNPASPLTANAYSWHFAPGISIRIPLGSSSGGGATGATANSGGASSGSGSTNTPGGKGHH